MTPDQLFCYVIALPFAFGCVLGCFFAWAVF